MLAALPRYDAFKDNAAALAGAGAEFIEIAGNRGIIVVSLISERAETLTLDTGYTLLLTQPILTEAPRRRHVIEVQVSDLSKLLREVRTRDHTLEHVYDY